MQRTNDNKVNKQKQQRREQVTICCNGPVSRYTH